MITAKLVHDIRWEKRSGKYPVKVRVTHERRSKYFETGVNLSKTDYEKLSAKRISAELNKIRVDLDEAVNKANQLIKEIKPFNFPIFEHI
jgi:integrase/recombinase XerD